MAVRGKGRDRDGASGEVPCHQEHRRGGRLGRTGMESFSVSGAFRLNTQLGYTSLEPGETVSAYRQLWKDGFGEWGCPKSGHGDRGALAENAAVGALEAE